MADTSKTYTQHVLKAHISTLVSALGGPDRSTEDNRYKLGDNALAVLKDLKKWLKFDKMSNKWDVALACGETGLVINDLMRILYQWETSYINGEIFKGNKLYNDRIANLCLELLVPLTWPLQLVAHESSLNQVTNFQRLKNYQLQYKKDILDFQGGAVLKAVIRILIPIISLSKYKRSTRDNSILNLGLLFYRNILSIEPGQNEFKSKKTSSKEQRLNSELPADVKLEDISVDLVIKVFDKNKVLRLFLTIFSGLGSEFDDKIFSKSCLECVFYLFKGIDPAVLLETAAEQQQSQGSELKDLLAKESKLKSKFVKETGSRHSRFGSLLSINTQETGRLTVSGQKALMSTEKTMERLNDVKKWNSSKRRVVGDPEELNSWEESTEHLSKDAKESLGQFMNDFIDGGFNQFVILIRKRLSSDGEDSSFVRVYAVQYCLVLAFCLKFERLRKLKPGPKELDEESEYGLVASVLLEDNIRLLKVIWKEQIELKDISVAQGSCVVFKEILLLLNSMAASKVQKDVDISANAKKRIFIDDELLNSFVSMSKLAHNRNLKFISSMVELLDISFRILERISKDESMVIVNKGKQAADDEEARERRLKIKEFDFNTYFLRFNNENTINSYMRVLQNYDKVNSNHIKISLKFLHKIFFKFKQPMLLFRMDFLLLMYKMIDDSSVAAQKEVQQFFKYYMKSLRYHLERTPSLYVELLFPKLRDSIGYLETGERQVEEKNKEIELVVVKPIEFTIQLDDQEKVESLVVDIKPEIMKSVLNALKMALEKLGLGEKEIALELQEESAKKALIKNAALRLQLSVIGFELPENYNGKCVLTKFDYERLNKMCKGIEKELESPNWLMTVKTLTQKVKQRSPDEGYDQDMINQNLDGDEDFVVADDPLDQLERLIDRKKKHTDRKSIRKSSPDSAAEKPVKPQKHYSSEMYVNSEDDLTDEEDDKAFFDKENRIRELLDKNGGMILKSDNERFNAEYFSVIETATPKKDSTYKELVQESFDYSEETSEPEPARKRRKFIVDDDDN